MNRSPRVTTFSMSLTQHFIRKTEGDYKNDNFLVMVTAVDEYLTEKPDNSGNKEMKDNRCNFLETSLLLDQ